MLPRLELAFRLTRGKGLFKSGAKSPHFKKFRAKLSLRSVLCLVCLRSGSTIQLFNDVTI